MTTKTQRAAGVYVDHENREKDDFYHTEPKATRALLEREKFEGAIWEPACGQGHISDVLKAAGYDVISSDLVDRGYGESRIDFLMEYQARAPNIVTNYPFKLGLEFMEKSLQLATGKIAFFCKVLSLAGQERYNFIYSKTPPSKVYIFSSRIESFRGGEKKEGTGGGTIDFCWMVWDKAYTGPTIIEWIAPLD